MQAAMQPNAISCGHAGPDNPASVSVGLGDGRHVAVGDSQQREVLA